MSGGAPLSPRGRLLVSGLFCGVGLLVMGMSAWDPGSVNGPWWLGFAAGAVFACGGLAVGTQGTPVERWVGPAAVGGILVGFAVLGNWIAFGPGPRACTGGVSILVFGASGSAGEVECRAAFGVGAVFINGLLLTFALQGAARAAGSGAAARRLEKAGEAILLLALSPLLFLAAALAVVATGWRALRGGARRLVAKRRSGRDRGGPPPS